MTGQGVVVDVHGPQPVAAAWKPFSTAMPMPTSSAPAWLTRSHRPRTASPLAMKVVDDQDPVVGVEPLLGEDLGHLLLVGVGEDLALIEAAPSMLSLLAFLAKTMGTL